MPMHSATMYLTAALDLVGIKGFYPAPDNDPDHGVLSMVDIKGQAIRYSHKMRGWHCTAYPSDTDFDLLPMPFQSPDLGRLVR